MSKTILVLAANPKDTPPLRLDQEIREIDNGLQRAQKRDEFILKQKLAVRPIDVRRAMLDYRPNIVHFCGHSSGEEGIAFEDENGQAKLVSTEALAGFFELFVDRVECVVLNACYSEVQAEAISKHIPHVIGMKRAIGDTAAIEFATAFYDALGAGESIEFAFKLACNSIHWAGLPENLTPVLISTNRLVGPLTTPPVSSVVAFKTYRLENQEFLFSVTPWAFSPHINGEDIKSKYTPRSERNQIVPRRGFSSQYPTIAANKLVIDFHLKNVSSSAIYLEKLFLKVTARFVVSEKMFWNTWMPIIEPHEYEVIIKSDESFYTIDFNGRLIEIDPGNAEHFRLRVTGEKMDIAQICEFVLGAVFHDLDSDSQETMSDRNYHIAFRPEDQ
jgi:hypothetical protein